VGILRQELAHKHKLRNSPRRTIHSRDPTFEDWTVHQQNEMLPTNSGDVYNKEEHLLGCKQWAWKSNLAAYPVVEPQTKTCYLRVGSNSDGSSWNAPHISIISMAKQAWLRCSVPRMVNMILKITSRSASNFQLNIPKPRPSQFHQCWSSHSFWWTNPTWVSGWCWVTAEGITPCFLPPTLWWTNIAMENHHF